MLIRQTTAHFLLMPLLWAFGLASPVLAQQAEAVWTEFDGEQHAIYIASYDGEQWTRPTAPVYVSNNNLTAAKLGTDANGDKLLIWSEQIIDKTILNYLQTSNQTQWSKPKVLYAAGEDNIAGSIVFDGDNTGWFFWSTVDTDLADIVYRQFIDGKPSAVQPLHNPNEVPDIHANASLDERGNVRVEWTSYNMGKGRYERVEKTLEVAMSARQALNPEQETLPDEIPVAEFLPENRSSLVHIPGNRMIQSAPIGR